MIKILAMGLDRSHALGPMGEEGETQPSLDMSAARTGLELSDLPIAHPSSIRADRRVGEALERLRDRGFLVVLDIEQDDGTMMHLVSGPSGVFLIEARRRRCPTDDLILTRERAEDLRAELETWVTPVICLTGPFARGPRRREKVWMVSRRRIASWIEGRRNPVLEGRPLLRGSKAF
jgi:hypothetical protein